MRVRSELRSASLGLRAFTWSTERDGSTVEVREAVNDPCAEVSATIFAQAYDTEPNEPPVTYVVDDFLIAATCPP